MRHRYALLACAMLVCADSTAFSPPAYPLPAPGRPTACQVETLEGEVAFGQPFSERIGGGLALVLQPIHSGWILRVVPAGTTPAGTAAPGYLDYAELATPPYQSVTPLSISTDFAFRAQDAVGWNPRRFRFAATRAQFDALHKAYTSYMQGGKQPSVAAQSELARLVVQAPEGVFRIVDARLVPGTANQWKMASAVSLAFSGTAHTFVQPGSDGPTPLGKLVSIRFRVALELPHGVQSQPELHPTSQVCGTL